MTMYQDTSMTQSSGEKLDNIGNETLQLRSPGRGIVHGNAFVNESSSSVPITCCSCFLKVIGNAGLCSRIGIYNRIEGRIDERE